MKEDPLWWLSSVCNVLLGGVWPETMCSRAYRNRHQFWFGLWFKTWNFIWRDETHCVTSHLCYLRRIGAIKGGDLI